MLLAYKRQNKNINLSWHYLSSCMHPWKTLLTFINIYISYSQNQTGLDYKRPESFVSHRWKNVISQKLAAIWLKGTKMENWDLLPFCLDKTSQIYVRSTVSACDRNQRPLFYILKETNRLQPHWSYLYNLDIIASFPIYLHWIHFIIFFIIWNSSHKVIHRKSSDDLFCSRYNLYANFHIFSL